jgi:hypothetical protein
MRVHSHSLLPILGVHALVQAKAPRLELWKCLLLMLLLHLLRNQARREMRAVTGADMRMRTAIIKRELSKLHNRVMEELRVCLRIEERRRLVIFEAILLDEVWGRMRRRDIGVGLTRSSPMTSEICHVSPFTALTGSICGARV